MRLRRTQLILMSLFAVAAALGAAKLLGGPAREAAHPPRAELGPAPSARERARAPEPPAPSTSPGASPTPSASARPDTRAAEALLAACRGDQDASPAGLAILVEALPAEGLEPLRRRLRELRPEVPEERRELETLGRALARGANRRGPQTLLGELLGTNEDPELHHRLLRELPLGVGSARAAAAAASAQPKPLLRISLLGIAGQLLERERDEEVEAVLRRLAQTDPRERVRAAAVTALGRPLGPANFTVLEDVILRDPSDQVRAEALASIARPGSDRALLTLNGVATDRREPLAVRLSALRALGKLGTERAAAALEEVAKTAAEQQEIRLAETLARGVRARLAAR